MLRTSLIRSAENLLLSMDGAEDAKVGSGTSSTTRSAENSSASVDMAEDVEVGEVMVVMIKRSKDHFPRSQTYLRDILPPYAPKK